MASAVRHCVLAVLSSVGLGCASGEPAPAVSGTTPGVEHAHHHEAGPPEAEHAHHHGQGPLVHRFDDAERWAKELDDPSRDAWQKPDEVVARIGVAPGMTVVDLGAGTGYFLPHLARAVGETGKVFALDVEPNLVAHMKARVARQGLANVEVRQVGFDDPELAPASVSRVLIVDTWHHIAHREAYAIKLAAALVSGGRVAVVDFTADATRGPPREHRLAPDQVIRELSSAGLASSVVDETLPDQYIVVAIRR